LRLAGPSGDRRSNDVVKLALADRVAELTGSLRLPHGAIFERGRWQMRQQQWAEARHTLEELVAHQPKSSIAADARSLALRARLELALTFAHVNNPKRDDEAAAADIEALA